MAKEVLTIKNATEIVSNGMDELNTILDDVSLTVNEGDFITVLGGNGAGKSTLFNAISGTLQLTEGTVNIEGHDITHDSEEKRAKYIARVFQDPKMGTAGRMTVSENLLLSKYRGKKRGLKNRKLAAHRDEFYELTKLVGNGLEEHLDTPTGRLSGGQRQALSLLMATMTNPELLLLDEHTAALDPKTSTSLMQLTDEVINREKLTCLMITHHMEDALKYGNRLIVMQKGKIVKDYNAEEKKSLKMADLLGFFE
jgi:putative ABC transport system ATP-binding protein